MYPVDGPPAPMSLSVLPMVGRHRRRNSNPIFEGLLPDQADFRELRGLFGMRKEKRRELSVREFSKVLLDAARDTVEDQPPGAGEMGR